ncbi:monofunctional biosynthetic peptidoglycan transglycosylase [Brevundimonas sp.]|uniref:monofunctional biosynthetic peptidoglycan transglycosylase n=1 Tax=Brevundimonas sp. TaxID=1871086 RepID=UPI0025FF03B9|nr:monofunctional biosynthetic peptidoglycan transglycosylase [Brevundimonas sp.]
MNGEASKRRRFGWLTVLLIVLMLPALGVLIHAVVPPPMTILMVQRAFEGEGFHKRWRGLNDISPDLVDAVIAAEDARFCSHQGFDLEAIQEALEENANGRRMRGGSTISQQTAKNVFLWPGRDWVRKGLEAGYTVLIEAIWTKRRIVEVYLNVAEWGPGVYGAEAAARHWFGKSASELTRTEAARLAAILPSPRRYQASEPGPYVRRRARSILAAMGTVRADGLSDCVA